MNQQEQKWLVLLYTIMELDGEATKDKVLQHIQNNNYWHKNDQNSELLITRPEMKWRNDFAFERHHLVKQGFLSNRVRGKWILTESGKNFLSVLMEKAKNNMLSDKLSFTPLFLQKIYYMEVHVEETVDQFLLEHIIHADNITPSDTITLINEPLPKGEVIRRIGNKPIYRRDPVISLHALSRAGHRCEIDASHPSFLRKNASCLYMEPHHLIPMSMTDHYGVSLDREQNIFSLCSNCHNQIHYGTKEDVRHLLSLLFDKRAKEISSILGKQIFLDELYEIYHT